MAARTLSDTKRRRRRRPDRAHRDQRRQTTPAEAKKDESSGEEQGFLFDPYWDEVFAAYYEPYLRTCCPIR